MKTLAIDIETTPNMAHVWGLWQQNVSLSQLIEVSDILCFAAKWFHQKQVVFRSVHHHGKAEMLEKAHQLLSEADVVVHYNGKSFDIPHLNREFLLAGMPPPEPYKQVDLLKAVRQNFRFPSNKLAYVSEVLKLGGKVQHQGHTLWIKCMAGDRKAWAEMRRYNIQDTALLRDLYLKVAPWVTTLPMPGLYDNPGAIPSCPACESTAIHSRGYAYTQVSAYQRYACTRCGRWFRGGRVAKTTTLR